MVAFVNNNQSPVIQNDNNTNELSKSDTEKIKENLKLLGYDENEINFFINNSPTNGKEIPLDFFNKLDIDQLNDLKYAKGISDEIKQLLHVHVPVSLVQAIGNPKNWSNGSYVGFGSEMVNAILNGKDKASEQALDALILSVLIIRTKLLQKQVEDQIAHIKELNAQLEEINDALDKATAKKTQANEDTGPGMTPEMRAVWEKYDADIQDAGDNNRMDASEWDANIRSLKSESERITSLSQIETTKLQQKINKYNQSNELLNSFLSKYDRTASTLAKGG